MTRSEWEKLGPAVQSEFFRRGGRLDEAAHASAEAITASLHPLRTNPENFARLTVSEREAFCRRGGLLSHDQPLPVATVRAALAAEVGEGLALAVKAHRSGRPDVAGLKISMGDFNKLSKPDRQKFLNGGGDFSDPCGQADPLDTIKAALAGRRVEAVKAAQVEAEPAPDDHLVDDPDQVWATSAAMRDCDNFTQDQFRLFGGRVIEPSDTRPRKGLVLRMPDEIKRWVADRLAEREEAAAAQRARQDAIEAAGKVHNPESGMRVKGVLAGLVGKIFG